MSSFLNVHVSAALLTLYPVLLPPANAVVVMRSVASVCPVRALTCKSFDLNFGMYDCLGQVRMSMLLGQGQGNRSKKGYTSVTKYTHIRGWSTFDWKAVSLYVVKCTCEKQVNNICWWNVIDVWKFCMAVFDKLMTGYIKCVMLFFLVLQNTVVLPCAIWTYRVSEHFLKLL